MEKHRYRIGIDPGTHTGLAIRDTTIKSGCDYVLVTTTDFVGVQDILENPQWGDALVIVEVSTRKSIGKKAGANKIASDAIAIDVGGVMREAALLVAQIHRIATKFQQRFTILAVEPQTHALRRITKWNAAQVAALTKYTGRTSDHARDAMMLIVGR